MATVLPPIPGKRYFTIGEVSELCGVKPHVLRYWEQEFTQLKPIKRRGNRRYYQHHEVLLVRRIRDLLYEQGFTISGARQQLISNPKNQDEVDDVVSALANMMLPDEDALDFSLEEDLQLSLTEADEPQKAESAPVGGRALPLYAGWQDFRRELMAIRSILEED